MQRKKIKELLHKCVEVTWTDIASQMGERYDKINSVPVEALCVVCSSYGILHKADDFGIVLCSEMSDEECDYTAIPYQNILDVEELVHNTHKNIKEEKM